MIDLSVVKPLPLPRMGGRGSILAARVRRHSHLLALVVILGVAGVARFWDLQGKGLAYWDEGLYGLEAIFLLHVPGHLADIVKHYPPGETPPYFPGHPPVFAKPTHDLLLALAMAVLGQRDWVLLGVSAAFGVATVLATYLIARSIFSPGIGLLSAGILAVLPYHIHYSRDARAEVDSALLVLIGLWAYHKAWTEESRSVRYRIIAGLCFGLAVTAQCRLYVLAYVLVIQELLSLWQTRRTVRPRRWVRDAAAMGAACFAPVVAWEVAHRLLLRYARSQGETSLPFQLYSQQIERVFVGFVGGLPWPDVGDLGFYPAALVELGSGTIGALAAAGALVALFARKRSPGGLLVASQFLVIVIYFSLMYARAPRYLVVVLPVMSVLAALGLSGLWDLGRSMRGVRLLVAVAIGAAMIEAAAAGPLVYSASGMRAAADWLAEQGQPRALAFQRPLLQFYAGERGVVADASHQPAELSSLYRAGFRYLVVDDQAYLYGDVPAVRFLSRLERTVVPAFSVPDPAKEGPMFYLEHAEWLSRDREGMLSTWAWVRRERGPASVRAYDLALVVEAIATAER